MDENNQNNAKPTIDKEYLKKLAEKIKAEKARKEALGKKSDSIPTPPPISSISSKYLDDDDEEMASEKTAIIDLSALSGHPADAKLTIVDGKDTGKNIEITKDEIIAGRSLDNDFVISDSSVSRKHFKITKDGDRFMIADMGSGNGTKVNGTKITSAGLSDGDIISAGARQIKFEILNPELKPKQQAQKVTKPTIQPVYDVEDEEPVKKKGSSAGILIAIIVILLIGIGGVAYFMLFDNQNNRPAKTTAVQPAFGEQDKAAIERMIAAKDLKNAEKAVLAANEKTSGDNPYKSWLNEQTILIGREKTNQITFENGKTKLAQKNPEGEELLKKIPENSIFYKDAQNLLLSAPKKEEPKQEEVKEEPKKEEPKAEPKKEEKKAEPKKEEKKAEPKKEEKKAEPKAEPKKEEPKKEEPKAEPKKEEPKKAEKKAEPKPEKPAKKKATMSEDEAKRLYMEAKAMEDSDPEEAKKLLKKIIDSVDPESKRYKKAKELLEKL